MKIALAQQNYHIGSFESNFEKMKTAINTAREAGADVVVFSELSVCGYPPRDFLEFDDFIGQCYQTIERLKPLSQQIAIICGAPCRNPNKEGKDLYNSAWFLFEGEVRHIAHKTLLPTYDVFDEYRYFEPGKNFDLVSYKGYQIALTICEDIWNIGNENPLYPVSPMDELVKKNPDFMINLSASPFDYRHAAERLKQVQSNASRYHIPVYYVNTVGAQTEIVFDGGSCVYDAQGRLYRELAYFTESVEIIDHQDVIGNCRFASGEQAKDKMQLVHEALLLGIRDYFHKMKFERAILGLSGGVDSALTLVLAVEALGKDKVLPVLLPSQFSSTHSVDDSVDLCQRLGVAYKTIPIETAYQSFLGLLQPHFEGRPFNVAEENLQSRSRAVILMGLANKLGYILLNTTNKSEAAVGYGTLYGDMCGGLSVLADLYKTEVYELCRHINLNHEVIPESILTKAPSAELRPNQKDSDSLPDYDLLDRILYAYLEQRKSLNDICSEGYSRELVSRVMRLVNSNEWKRHQMAPVIRISPKSFGVGRRMPIVAQYTAVS